MIYFGVVEERSIRDEYRLGRCKVRIFGVHSEDKNELPTDELPWAFPISDITQAQMSQIGQSPTGIVEGSWVVIVFADEYKQHPMIIGTTAGIPFKYTEQTTGSLKFKTEHKTQYLKDDSGNLVTDSGGNPVQTGEPAAEPPNAPEEAAQAAPVNQAGMKLPREMELQPSGRDFIISEEALSSLTKGKNDFRKNASKLPDSTILYSYQDSSKRKVWTIGYGSTFKMDDSKVGPDTTMTKGEAIKLMDTKLKTEYVAGVKRNLKAPVTQSMFDACVSMAYNSGVGGLKSSDFFKALNAGKYAEAAALIEKANASGLANRRDAEKKLFEADGLPDKLGELQPSPDKKLEDSKKPPTPATKPHTDSKKTVSEETGSIQGDPSNIQFDGFKDPNVVYPKYYNEPDTNRLSRHEKISETIVQKKDASRILDVKTADRREWNQPFIPYNAEWPYNHVKMTESGHVEEFDDTADNERIHRWHTAGTFEEIDVNSTRVIRIIGDDYEVLHRNGYMWVKGDLNITVCSNANIRVENDCTVEVLGDMETRVTGDYSLAVGGDIVVHSGGPTKFESDALWTAEAPIIHLNSGYPTGLPLPTEGPNGPAGYAPLTTPGRRGPLDSFYETPEEGDNSGFIEKNRAVLDVDAEKPAVVPEKPETTEPEKKPPVTPPPAGCDGLRESDLVSQLRLQPLFTLGQVARGESGIPSGIHYGMPATEIVCNLKKLTINVLDKIKAKYPSIIIRSGWRSEAVNKKYNGVKSSDHLYGRAADIEFPGFTREQYYQAAIEIQKMTPAYKQIILEYKGAGTWIHVSYDEKENRNEVLTMDATKNVSLKPKGKFILI